MSLWGQEGVRKFEAVWTVAAQDSNAEPLANRNLEQRGLTLL